MDLIESLIFSQSVESLDDLNAREVLDLLVSDSRADDETLAKFCERISFLIFQDLSYGIGKLNDPTTRSILNQINYLCKTWIDSEFSFIKGPEYFAGSLPSTSSSSQYGSDHNYTKERILCAYLTSNNILKQQDFLGQLHKLIPFYSSSRCLAELLINNDDRCLSVIVALLPYIETIPPDSIFFAPSLFFETLKLISYDSEVVIDWLTSELIASSLFLRVLKLTCHSENVEYWKNVKPSPSSRETRTRWCSYNNCSSEKPDVSLKISELAGDVSDVRVFNLSGSEEMVYNSGLTDNTEETTTQDVFWLKWVELVVILKDKLRKIEKAKLTGMSFSTLIKWCERFCEINS